MSGTEDAALPATASPSAAARVAAPGSVALPIDSIIVFEDRAQVTRRGVLGRPPAGVTSTVTIEGVSPLAVERTIEATAPRWSISQVRLRRWLDTATTDNLTNDPELQAAYEDALDQLRRHEQHIHQLRAEITSLQAVRDLTLDELAVAVNESTFADSRADQQLATIRTHEQRARVALADAQAVERQVRRTFDDLSERLAAAQSVTSSWRAALDIDLGAPIAGSGDPDAAGVAAPAPDGPPELIVRYIVPNAAWRPAHVATRADDGTTVTVRSEAVVWQATEERWDDVELVLSTARTSSATEPPPVEDDVLRLIESGREIEIEWREADDVLGDAPVFAELPSVDDGGEPRRLVADGRVTVGPDGLPNRVPVATFATAATADLVCRPERSATVHRRTRQVNDQAHPLLAGPVLLVEHGGVTGWTTTPYVGPGERFELGWGPEVALEIDRRTETRDDASITGTNATDHRVHLELHNNGATPCTVEVVERVPVSEIDRVKVDIDDVQPAARPDADGLVRWTVTVEPDGATATLTLGYTVRRHRSVAT